MHADWTFACHNELKQLILTANNNAYRHQRGKGVLEYFDKCTTMYQNTFTDQGTMPSVLSHLTTFEDKNRSGDPILSISIFHLETSYNW